MKIYEAIEKSVKETVVSQGMKLIEKNPEQSANRLFNLVKKFSKNESTISTIEFMQDHYQADQPTADFINSILKDTDQNCLKKLFANFFANALWFGVSKRAKLLQEDVKVPFVILLSPSMRCNLNCAGCYAGDYEKQGVIPFDEVDRIVNEARELGIYYFVILGGEPFINEFMLDIYEKYNDVMFTPFTNGTLFTPKLADRLRELGNVIPMFSLEGFEEATDARRGKGIFKTVMNGMDLLRERGVLFGVSSAVTRSNMDVVSSDAFVDMVVAKGAKVGFYFIYMPVGSKPDVDMMLTPAQRIDLGRRIRRHRAEKAYFPIDFFNDAPYVGGCIAGKYYCHINSKEDVEPCIFGHFACDNLKGKRLIDVFKSPLFRNLRHKQPYNENMLLPCMMIDNPDVIRQVVEETGAYPTDESARMMISDPDFMHKLDRLAAGFTPYAEQAWQEDFNNSGNMDMAKG